MKPIGILCFFLLATNAAIAQPAPAPAAPDYSKTEEISTDLGHGLYAIAGAGGNTTVAVGSKGLLVIDTQYAPAYANLRAKISSLSPKPVLYVVNTHYHVDHVGGNAQFHQKDDAAIVAAPQVPGHMLHPPPLSTGQPGVPAVAEAIPTAPYSGSGTKLDVGGIIADLVHPAMSAHTDGDTIILFPAENVIATGDIVVLGGYPYIDIATGGNIDGVIAAAKFILAHSNAATKIVPGHGPVSGQTEMKAYIVMLETARDRIAKAKSQGMSEQQVVDTKLLADLDAKLNAAGSPMAALFPVNVYRSLK